MNIPPEADEEVPYNQANKKDDPPKKKQEPDPIEQRDIPDSRPYPKEAAGSHVSKSGIRRGNHGSASIREDISPGIRLSRTCRRILLMGY